MKVDAADGWSLDVSRIAAKRPIGAALLLPAMMVDRRTMDRPPGRGLGSTLAAAGWDVYLGDFRGHGRSGPRMPSRRRSPATSVSCATSSAVSASSTRSRARRRNQPVSASNSSGEWIEVAATDASRRGLRIRSRESWAAKQNSLSEPDPAAVAALTI